MSKPLLAGIFSALIGVMVSLLPSGLALEESIGLELLFKSRVAPTPPDNILIVSIDRSESGRPKTSRAIPRAIYGRLVDILAAHNAKTIVFDMTFSEPDDSKSDALFAQAIARAGNVILCEYLERKTGQTDGSKRSVPADIHIEKRILPLPLLAENAALTAPFPLPKIPIRLNRYWTFKKESGDQYTLPVAVIQFYLRDIYPQLRERILTMAPDLASDLPDNDTLATTDNQHDFLLRKLRDIFSRNPLLSRQLLNQLRQEETGLPPDSTMEHKALETLIMMYGGTDNRYLNFYGPAGTIPTISLEKILSQQRTKGSAALPPDLTETIVFIGLSQLSGKEQSDNFYTVFSQSDGIDLNGVEVAATACANLLDNKPLTPLSQPYRFALFILWGLLVALICFFLSPLFSFLGLLIASSLFFLLSRHFFSTAGLWTPLAVPLLIQMPATYLTVILWKLSEAKRERHNIKTAFKHYLPDEIVKQLAKKTIDIQAENKIVHGICLYTDAEDYTSVSEKLDQTKLPEIMNRYFQAASQPVLDHGGVVSDITGDAMLAIWVSPPVKEDLRLQACLAALDIVQAVKKFNAATPDVTLPTRVGLHVGTMMLGNIGALNHYEYTPIGDVVNTASRLESLNKQLGTRVLVSDECVEEVNGVLSRQLGSFLLVGKSRPVSVSELICRQAEATEMQLLLCDHFKHGLNLYQCQKWTEAEQAFRQVLEIDKEDGPATFYSNLCNQFMQDPPAADWHGIFRLQQK